MKSIGQKISLIFSFLILFLLFGLLWRELYYAHPNKLPSHLIGESMPAIQLTNLIEPQTLFSEKDWAGQVILLNVWATWCYACKIEHPMLMKIKEQYHIPIYSLVYKDNPDLVKKWLTEQGNPYTAIGNDSKGDAAIDLGVYGTPETFVINKQGKIIYRHVGAITQNTWDTILYPIIKQIDETI